MREWTSRVVSSGTWALSDAVVWAGPSGGRVLVIDDDQGLSRLVALVLKRSGFTADIANSGDAGLTLLESTAYDAVVLDLRMPGKDGRTVFKEMREKGNQTPVLILSAYDARRAHEDLGAEAYLNKPFEPDKLVTAIQAMLETTST